MVSTRLGVESRAAGVCLSPPAEAEAVVDNDDDECRQVGCVCLACHAGPSLPLNIGLTCSNAKHRWLGDGGILMAVSE